MTCVLLLLVLPHTAHLHTHSLTLSRRGVAWRGVAGRGGAGWGVAAAVSLLGRRFSRAVRTPWHVSPPLQVEGKESMARRLSEKIVVEGEDPLSGALEAGEESPPPAAPTEKKRLSAYEILGGMGKNQINTERPMDTGQMKEVPAATPPRASVPELAVEVDNLDESTDSIVQGVRSVGPISAGAGVMFSPSDNSSNMAVSTPVADSSNDVGSSLGEERGRLSSAAENGPRPAARSLAGEDEEELDGKVRPLATSKRASTAWVHNATDLAGEAVLLTSKQVSYFSLTKQVGMPGQLDVTNFKLKFTPHDPKGLNAVPDGLFVIPLMTVHRMTLKRLDENPARKKDLTEIIIRCKDCRLLRFEVNDEILPMNKLEQMFEAYLYPGNPKYLFAFDHKYEYANNAPGHGHSIYSLEREMVRMGLLPDPAGKITASVLAPTVRMTTVNDEYKICATYPKMLIVPAGLEDRTIRDCATFRTKGRFPTMTFAHPGGGSIWRSSQPMIGRLGNSINRSDETMLYTIANTSPRKGPKKLVIVDCRPKINAFANRANGGGFEGANYRNARLDHWDMANIHGVRGSFEKLAQACMHLGNDVNFGAAVEESGWLGHIRTALRAGLHVAERVGIHQDAVLVHCSDGWDRTPLLCAMAQVILDPYFRTIEGFSVLVQKSFCSFGHRVHYRTGHGERTGTDKDTERAPILFQFLECIFQLMDQFPTAFEYTDQMLIEIADNLWSCRFGTFLLNCEREREQQGVYTKTKSLWSFIAHERAHFLNPFYDSLQPDNLRPRFAACSRHVCLWKTFWLRFSPRSPSHNVTCPVGEQKLRAYLLHNADAIKQHAENLQGPGTVRVAHPNALDTMHIMAQFYALKYFESQKDGEGR